MLLETVAKYSTDNNFLIWKSPEDAVYFKSRTESENVAPCNFDHHAGKFDRGGG